MSWLRRKVGQSVRMILAQTRQPKFVPDLDQPSLFAPDSMVRVVHLDAAMIVGGIRALLLQLLHPKAMTAVAQHSDYRADPFGRLRRTVDFLGWTTYGTLSKAEESLAAVRRIHEGVVGVTAWGEPYRADDPHLLLWVHVAEVDSFLVAHELFGRPRLSQPAKDHYVADMGIIATRLGAVDPPASQQQLQDTLAGYRSELGLIPEGQEAVGFLADFPFKVLSKALYRIIFKAALGSLPGWAQAMLGHRVGRLANKLFYRPATHVMVRFLDWGLKADLDLTRYPAEAAEQAVTAQQGQ